MDWHPLSGTGPVTFSMMVKYVPEWSQSRSDRKSPHPPHPLTIAAPCSVWIQMPLRWILKRRTSMQNWQRFPVATPIVLSLISVVIPHPHHPFPDAPFQGSQKILMYPWWVPLHPILVSLSLNELFITDKLPADQVDHASSQDTVISPSHSQSSSTALNQPGEHNILMPDKFQVCYCWPCYIPGPSPGPSTPHQQPAPKRRLAWRSHGGVEIPSLHQTTTPPLRRSIWPTKMTERARYELEEKERYDMCFTEIYIHLTIYKGCQSW